MVINTNTTAMFAQRILANSNNQMSKSLARLSSGSQLVSPEDDAAGLAVSMKFKAEIGRIGAARTNVGNAISYSQTQDGFLGTISKSLRRMSELATLSADQTKTDADVLQYRKEFDELRSFIEATSTKTFNGIGLFATTLADDMGGYADADVLTDNAALTTALTAFKTGPVTVALANTVQDKILDLADAVRRFENDNNTHAVLGTADAAGRAAAVSYWEGTHLGATYDVSAPASSAGAANLVALVDAIQSKVKQMFGGLKVTDSSDASTYQIKGVDISVLTADVKGSGTMAALSKTSASSYVTKLSTHIDTLAGNRAYAGANISRLGQIDGQLAVYGENLSAANSRIEDVDIAVESSNFARQQILVQSGTSMLAQANIMPQSALQLIS